MNKTLALSVLMTFVSLSAHALDCSPERLKAAEQQRDLFDQEDAKFAMIADYLKERSEDADVSEDSETIMALAVEARTKSTQALVKSGKLTIEITNCILQKK